MDQATEDVYALDSSGESQWCHRGGCGGSRNVEINTTGRPAAVVMRDIPVKDVFEMPLVPDQRPVQAFGSHGANPSLRIGVPGIVRAP